jgi:hypothetical protein
MMRDEIAIEEVSLRATQEKMDEAFRAAMLKAIDAKAESAPTTVATKPSTRHPKVILA